MPYICDNPSCQYHLSIPASMKHKMYAMVDTPSKFGSYEMTKVDRFLYVKRSYGYNEKFYLCNSCHSAVEMPR